MSARTVARWVTGLYAYEYVHHGDAARAAATESKNDV